MKARADVELITRSIRYAMERARSERHRAALLREQLGASRGRGDGRHDQPARAPDRGRAHQPLARRAAARAARATSATCSTPTPRRSCCWTRSAQVLEVRAERGLYGEVDVALHGARSAPDFAGRIVSERRSIVIDDVATRDVLSPILRQKVKSLLGVPLLADDRIIGVMHVGTTGRASSLPRTRSCCSWRPTAPARAIERARRFQQEHETAVTLQRSLLPDRLPDIPGLALAARYLPGAAGTEVGGDWYDVIPLADGRVGIAMGDVVGRGIPAASLMGQLRNGLRAYAIEGHPPCSRARAARPAGAVAQPGPHGDAALHGARARRPQRASFANAGHLPPLVVEAGPHARACSRALAACRSACCRTRASRRPSARLEPGSTLVLYTDGLVEERGISIEIRLHDLQRVASDRLRGTERAVRAAAARAAARGRGRRRRRRAGADDSAGVDRSPGADAGRRARGADHRAASAAQLAGGGRGGARGALRHHACHRRGVHERDRARVRAGRGELRPRGHARRATTCS